MNTVLVTGNPKPRSRTRDAGTAAVVALTGAPPEADIDLADLAPMLLSAGHPELDRALSTAASAELLVVASPTYKGSYTGMLKAFLDRLPHRGLTGVPALALMTGSSLIHALAPHAFLEPVLVELGATLAGPGLFIAEDQLPGLADSAELAAWRDHVLNGSAAVARLRAAAHTPS